MNPAPDNPSERTEFVEELLAEALAIAETDGSQAVEDFLAAHPDEAEELRAALASLDRMQLLEQPKEGTLPEQFGEFVIKEELGKGGMGVVFVAEQQSLNREVALKIVRPELLMFPGARERFRREIESVARLEHTAIVPILATGEANGIPYYAMPRLRGQDAERVVRQLAERDPRQLQGSDIRAAIHTEPGSDAGSMFGSGYWQAAVRFVHQAALGIEHAHARGILHRDLKPSNLFLTTSGQAVVLDFGLARAGADSKLTRTGSAAGSPAYMAPEQVRGEVADERTDVYGLAATLHCMLGLRPPFGNDGAEELRRRILAGERAELRRRTGVPPELELVLQCALDVDRKHRYASAQGFADDLLAVLEGRPIAARQLPRVVRTQRFLQRNPTVSAVVAMGLAFLLLLPALLLWQEQEASRKLQAQVKKTETANVRLQKQILLARYNEDVSIRAIQQLLAGLSTDELRLQIGANPIIRKMLEDALALFDSLPSNDAQPGRLLALKLDTMLKLHFLHEFMGNPELGEELVDRGLAVAERLPLTREQQGYLGRFELQKAILLKNRRAPGFATQLAKARATLQGLIDTGPAEDYLYVRLSDAMVLAGDAKKAEGDLEGAEREYRAAIATVDRPGVTDNTAHNQLKARYLLVRFFRSVANHEAALQVVDDLIATATTQPDTQRWPPKGFMEARGRSERFFILSALGRVPEARKELQLGIRLYEKLITDTPGRAPLYRDLAAAKSNLAGSVMKEDRFDDAIPLLREAIDDQKRALDLKPKLPQAFSYMKTHRNLLAKALRGKQDWKGLEAAAFDLARSPVIPLDSLEHAATDLLLCEQHAPPERRQKLRDTAFKWLLHCRKNNWKLRLDSPGYDSIRSDPRFAKLR